MAAKAAYSLSVRLPALADQAPCNTRRWHRSLLGRLRRSPLSVDEAHGSLARCAKPLKFIGQLRRIAAAAPGPFSASSRAGTADRPSGAWGTPPCGHVRGPAAPVATNLWCNGRNPKAAVWPESGLLVVRPSPLSKLAHRRRILGLRTCLFELIPSRSFAERDAFASTRS